MSDQFNILDYTDGPLLKTGQTTDYTPAGRTTKDDGGFQRGIAGSKLDGQYQILTTGQYAGNTSITVNGIVDVHSNGCVHDKVTGLMFSRTLNPSIYGVGSENLLWDDGAGSNEDIFEYCDQANLSNLSGFSDWRVPNINELLSLLIIAAPFGTFNTIAFPTITNELIVSATTFASASSLAVSLSVTTGVSNTLIKTLTRASTMLIRL